MAHYKAHPIKYNEFKNFEDFEDFNGDFISNAFVLARILVF